MVSLWVSFMPHTGKPSGACQQCKQRHTKVGQTFTTSSFTFSQCTFPDLLQCDEAKPACGYCVRAKRVCSGYSQGLDLVLRDQNEVAKAGVGRRQRASGRKSIQNPPGGPGSQPSTVVVVPQSLSESEESHALCFFVSTYVLYDRDTQADRGFVELLPLMFNNMKVRSPLSLCLAAASYVLFRERGLQNPTRKNLASSNYSKGLKATRMALQDPIESVSDETLMAVCLLGLYEVNNIPSGA